MLKFMESLAQHVLTMTGRVLFPPLAMLLMLGNQTSLGKIPLIIAPPTPTPTAVPTPTPTLIPTPTTTPTPSPIPSSTPTPTPTPIPVSSGQLDEWFTNYANHYSVERTKLWLIAVCESNLRPGAINGLYGGLYQFSPGTWRSTRMRMNADTDPDLRFHPEEAIKTAAFKISTDGLSAWPNCPKR